MRALFLVIALLTSTSASASAEQTEVYPIDCVQSEVSLAFKLRQVRETDRLLFEERAVVDTRCGQGADGDVLFQMVVRDVCQAVGSRGASCADRVGRALRFADAARPPLRSLTVAPIDGDLVELALAYANATDDALPAALDAQGRFEAVLASGVPSITHDALACHGADSTTVQGWVSDDAATANVEVGRSRTWLCSTPLDGVLLEIEVADVQRGGAGLDVVEAARE